MYRRNVCIHVQYYTLSKPRSLQSEQLLPQNGGNCISQLVFARVSTGCSLKTDPLARRNEDSEPVFSRALCIYMVLNFGMSNAWHYLVFNFIFIRIFQFGCTEDVLKVGPTTIVPRENVMVMTGKRVSCIARTQSHKDSVSCSHEKNLLIKEIMVWRL